MIITPDNNPKAGQRVLGDGIDDVISMPPPSYSAGLFRMSSSSESQVQSSSPPILPDLPPCNFVIVSHTNNSVKGTWIIDPSVIVPTGFLPPLDDDETEDERKNLALRSRNGYVDADVFVSPFTPAITYPGRRVLISAESRNGPVELRIHDVPSENQARPSCHIVVEAPNRTAFVRLPRSFRGPMRLETAHGKFKSSDGIKANTTHFSDLNGVRRCFLGQFDASEFTPDQAWEGDELTVVGQNGNIKVAYDDELIEKHTPKRKKSPGVMKKIFRF